MTETSPNSVSEISDGVLDMSTAELCAFLHAKTGIAIGEGDSICLEYALHQRFLSDFGWMLEHHNVALTAVLETAIKGLTADAIAQNLQEQIRLADRTHQLFENQYKRIKVLSIVNISIFFVCLLVFLYLVSK